MKCVKATLMCVFGVVGCAGAFSPVQQVQTYLPAREAEQRLEVGFTSLGLPVTERARNGRVTTGRFDPVTVWGGGTTDYVWCGRRAEPDLSARHISLEVIGTIRESVSRAVRVEIESYGKARNDRDEEIPCRLNQSAVEALLSSVPERDRRGG